MPHLRQISPVSVMLGCQILVKHFTLGGCNRETDHSSLSHSTPKGKTGQGKRLFRSKGMDQGPGGG